MFSKLKTKGFRFALVAAALFFVVGCAEQLVKTDEDVSAASRRGSGTAPPSSAMQEAARQRMQRMKSGIQQLENDLIYFDFDRFEIRTDMRGVLDHKARFLSDFPTIRIQIEGHADERGTSEYNIALGHRRAQAAKDYLVSLGVSASRVDTVSYGEERPVDPRHHEIAWAKNRRAKFNVIGGVPAGLN
ncbi:MAG: peptidoglycan-associated lipoprotein Pal [bacterium]|nr:peptidoglycan-associated lipoprotein Pal [bacterium]